MKKKCTALVVCLVLVAGCTQTALSEGYKNIGAVQFNEMIHKGNALILDVRTPGEYRQVRIKDSILIPVQVLNTEYTRILEHKNKKILIYCRSGNRSVAAANILIKQGFDHIYNLKGGIKEWIGTDLPVVTSN